MDSDNVKQYLDKIKSTQKFDNEFIDELMKGLDDKYEGPQIANNILGIIEVRYAKNQKDITERV